MTSASRAPKTRARSVTEEKQPALDAPAAQMTSVARALKTRTRSDTQ